MSEQNNYRIVCDYKSRETEEWTGWGKSWLETADNWQDAIHQWLDRGWVAGDYTVGAATPSEGGKSGIIEIQFGTPGFRVGAKIKATLIED